MTPQLQLEEAKAKFFGEKWEKAYFAAIQGILANPASTMMPNVEIVAQAGKVADDAVGYIRAKVKMSTSPVPPTNGSVVDVEVQDQQGSIKET